MTPPTFTLEQCKDTAFTQYFGNIEVFIDNYKWLKLQHY